MAAATMRDFLVWLGESLGHVSHMIIGALAGLVPIMYRDGTTKTQAAIMVLAGALGAWAISTPLVLLLDPILPGTAEDIDESIAFVVGLSVMRIAEILLRAADRIVNFLLFRFLGVRPGEFDEVPRRRKTDRERRKVRK